MDSRTDKRPQGSNSIFSEENLIDDVDVMDEPQNSLKRPVNKSIFTEENLKKKDGGIIPDITSGQQSNMSGQSELKLPQNSPPPVNADIFNFSKNLNEILPQDEPAIIPFNNSGNVVRDAIASKPANNKTSFDPATFMRNSRQSILQGQKAQQDNIISGLQSSTGIAEENVGDIVANKENSIAAKPLTQNEQLNYPVNPNQPFNLITSISQDYPGINPNEILGNKDLLSNYYTQKNELLTNQIRNYEASEKRGVYLSAIENLKKEQQELTQQVYDYNSIHAGLEGEGDAVKTGIILGKAMGNPYSFQMDRLMKKGIPVNPLQSVKNENAGLDAQLKTIDAQYKLDENNPLYVASRNEIQAKKSTLWDRHPEALNQQWGKVIGDYITNDLSTFQKNTGLWTRNLTDVINDMRKDGYDIPDEVVKNISWDNVPTNMDAAGRLLGGVVSHIAEKAASIERLGGTALGIDPDVLTADIEAGKEGLMSSFEVPAANQRIEANELVQTDKSKPNFLMSVPNPNAGKINPKGSLLGSVFEGLGSFATFVADVALTSKALQGAAELAISPNVANITISPEKLTKAAQTLGMDVTVFTGSYEPNYQKAVQLIGDNPEDEEKRNLLATTSSLFDVLAFKLPVEKYANTLFAGSKDAMLKEMGNAVKNLPANLKGLKPSTVEKVLTKGIADGLTAIKDAGVSTVKEATKLGIMQTAGAIGKKMAQSVIADNEASDEDWKFLPEEIKQQWESLPVALMPGVLGANLLNAGRASAYRKEAMFDAFNNRDRSLSDLAKALDANIITQNEYNQRAQVINTGADIVKTIPFENANGRPLSHSEEVSWMHNKLKEIALEAKREGVKDDVLQSFYDGKIKELQKERQDILEGKIPTENAPRGTSVIPPKTQEEIDKESPTVTPEIEETTPAIKESGASVILPQTVEKGREMPIVTTSEKSNENVQAETNIPKPKGETSVVNEEANKAEQPTEEKTAKLLEPHENSLMLSGYKTNDEKLKFIAQQAQNISDTGEKVDFGDGRKSAENAFGKELVDAAITKFPENDLLKSESNTPTSTGVKEPVSVKQFVDINNKPIEGIEGIESEFLTKTKQEVENGYKDVDSNFRASSVRAHEFWVEQGVENGYYENAIKENKITASDAKKIIESVGLEVPKDILDKTNVGNKSPKEQPVSKSLSEEQDLVDKIKSVQKRIFNEDGTNKKGATKEDIALNEKLMQEYEASKNKPEIVTEKAVPEVGKLQNQKNDLSKQKGIASDEMDKARSKVFDKNGALKKNAKQSDIDNLKSAKVKYDNISKQIEDIDSKQKELRSKSLKEGPKKEQPKEEVKTSTEKPKKEKIVGKFESLAKQKADKLRNAELPSWLVNNDPTIKKSGISADSIKNTLADAIELVGKLMDDGVEFAEAVKRGGDKLVAHFLSDYPKGEKLKSDFEGQVRKGFENEARNNFKDILEGNEGGTGGKPPVENVAGSGEGELGATGERRFTKQILSDKSILPAEEIRKNLEYVRQSNALTLEEATSVIDKVGVDEAYDLVVNDGELKPAIGTTVGQMLIKKYNTLAANAKDAETKEYYWDKTIQTANYVSEKLATEAGQGIQTFSLFSRLSPEAQLRAAIKDVKKQAKSRIDKSKPDVNDIGNKFQKANEETANEITEDKTIKSTIDKAEKTRAEKAQDKIKKARERREKIIAKYKKEKGGSLYSGVGLTKEGIEFVGDIVKTYIDEGIANAEILIGRVLSHLKEANGKPVTQEVEKNVNSIIADKIYDLQNSKIAVQLREVEKTVNENLSKYSFLPDEVKVDLIDKATESSLLKGEEKDKFRNDVYNEIDRIVEKKKTKITSDYSKVSAGVKELEKEIGQIIREHYTITNEQKKSLTDKFIEGLGVDKEYADNLSKEIQSEFDRIATRKKEKILFNEKKKFDRIKKGLAGSKKSDAHSLQSEAIKYSNLGAFDNNQLLELLSEKLGTGQLTPEQGKEIQRLAERIHKAPEGSPKTDATQDLLTYRANIKGNSWAEIAQGVWYANVLSGYLTHIRNIVSTFFNGTSFVAAELVRDPKSLPFLLYGGAKGFKRGGIEAWHTLTTGRSPIHVSKIETPQVLERVKFKGGLLNPANYLKYVGRMMVAEDVLQFQGLKEMRATQLAYRDAKKLGYKNPFSKEVWKHINENLLNTKERYESAQEQVKEEGLKGNEATRRTYELMEQSRPIQMQEDSYGFAAKGTFNHDTEGTLGALSDSISRFLDSSLQVGGSKPLRFIVPFTRIITNVANNTLDFSPIGLARAARGKRGLFASEASKKRVEMTKEERQQEIVKGALGTATMLAAYGLSQAGIIQISGAGPSDYKKRQQLEQEGWQPFSIKIGDTYYSYKLTPAVFGLGIVGSIRDHEQYDEDADEQSIAQRTSLALWDGARLISDMTWVNSAAPIMSAISANNPNEAGSLLSNAATGIGKGFVLPSAYTQSAEKIEQIFKIPKKETSGIFQSLITNIPIARNSFNDRINALGDPVVKDVDILTSSQTKDPVWKFLLDKKGWVAPVNKNTLILFDIKTQQDRPATPDEYYEFSKIRGKKIKEGIQDIMTNGAVVGKEGSYQYKTAEDLTPAELNKVLVPIKTRATKEAKKEMLINSINQNK